MEKPNKLKRFFMDKTVVITIYTLIIMFFIYSMSVLLKYEEVTGYTILEYVKENLFK